MLKKDRSGDIWSASVRGASDENEISMGRLSPSGDILDSRSIRVRGFNHSPDFAFDASNSPWIAWIQSAAGRDRVLVRDLRTGRTWVLKQDREGTLAGPKIVFTADNAAWIFWEGNASGKEGVFYSLFQGNAWTLPRLFNTGNPYPDVNPDAAVDAWGRVLLTWSGYDGNDYEIYISRWDGGGWSRSVRLTNDSESDGFPSISGTEDGRAVVFWIHSSASENILTFTLEEGTGWSESIPALQMNSLESLPRTFIEDGRIHVVRTWNSRIDVRHLVMKDLKRIGRQAPQPAVPSVIITPKPDENKYIGFGDSITFGTIKPLPPEPYYGEKGYIPRLEKLLTQSFGPTSVLNEGFPGELTAQGLSRMPALLSTASARHLLLMEGFNDVIFQNVTVASSAFNLKEMIRKCLQAGVFPAIATFTPRRDSLWFYQSVRDHFYALNNEIRKIAAELAVPLVEQYKAFNDYPESDGGLLSLLCEDLKHPNEKGYQLLAQTWFNEIKAFPFPPIDIQIKRRDFVLDSGFDRTPAVAAAARPSAVRPTSYPDGKGNLLTWSENPKILDKSRFKGYNIYRKKQSQTDDAYQPVALVTNVLKYFDTKIIVSESYSYIITTLRTDGVEGPCSSPVVR